MNDTLNIISILYGIVAFFVTTFWLYQKQFDTINVVKAVGFGLTWPISVSLQFLALFVNKIMKCDTWNHITQNTKDNLVKDELSLLQDAMFQMGIVPIEDPSMDFRKYLSQLPPDEATKLKRKFRKLWRKLARKKSQTSWVQNWYGAPGKNPNRLERYHRKYDIFVDVMSTIVRPAVKRFNSPSGKP